MADDERPAGGYTWTGGPCMRKVLILMLFLFFGGTLFAFTPGDVPAVSVRNAGLRSGAGFLAAITEQLDYGESVEVLEVRGDWVRVRVVASGDEGWLHTTTIEDKESLRLEQVQDSRTAGTTSREIALAGRGFNEQVEAEYKSEKGLDFTLVDEMEGYGQSMEGLATFFRVAGLTFGEGDTE